MAPHTRAALIAKILRLQKLQSEDLAQGLFCPWTVEQEVAHQKRSERIARLMSELATLDKITQLSV